MGRFLKWIGMGLAILVLALLVVVMGVYSNTLRRMNRTYAVAPEALNIPTDAASIANGEHIYLSHCLGCHGSQLEGSVVFADPAIGKIVSANLTSGRGGTVGGFTDADWALALRHGIGPDHKSLLVMPSDYYYYLNDKDLGDLIAYLKSAPPVDNDLGDSETTFLGTVLNGVGMLGHVFVAEHIDHAAPRTQPVPEAVSAAYGEYVVAHVGCRSCHGEDLRGGKSADPSAMPAPGLTKDERLAVYDMESFVTALRTGIRPDGPPLVAAEMPWPEFQHLTDTELQAAYLYLESLGK